MNKLLNEGSPIYKWCEVYYDRKTNNNTYYLPVIYAYSLFKHENINIVDDFTYTIEDDKMPRRIYGINNNEKVYDEKLINFVVILSSLDYQYIVSNMDKWLELKNYDNVSNYQRISTLWKNICQ